MNFTLSKISGISTKTITFVVILLLLAVSVGVGLYVYKNSKPKNQATVSDCSKIVEDSYSLQQKNNLSQSSSNQKDDANQTEAISSENDKKAYDQLKNKANECTQIKNSSEESRINILKYTVALASTAYASGDKSQAYEYAQTALKQYNDMPESLRKNSNMPQMENILNILETQRIEQMSKENAE